MSGVILTLAGGAGAAVLGAAATVFLEERRSRVGAARHTLAIVKAARDNIRSASAAAAYNEMILNAEIKAMSADVAGYQIVTLRPAPMPALDIVQAQHFELVPLETAIRINDLVGMREMAAAAHRARDTFKVTGTALSTFRETLAGYDGEASAMYKLLRDIAGQLDVTLAESRGRTRAAPPPRHALLALLRRRRPP